MKGSPEYRALQKNGADDEANDPVQYFFYRATKGTLEESVADLGSIFPIRTAHLKNKVGPKLLQLNAQTPPFVPTHGLTLGTASP